MMAQTFTINNAAHIGTVGLKVANLSKQVAFYTEIIGLDILGKDDDSAVLGIKGNSTELLKLKEVQNPNMKAKKAGLYHTAFLLPTRKDLGNTLFSLLKNNTAIIGASDHGYSEAVYLEDPEGNGIEIYSDKPETEWDVRPDGQIIGITVEMDAEGVLASRDEKTDKFPVGTKIGHIHLSVSDLEQTENFYMNTLGMGLKDHFGQYASFFAAGSYHHHIGTNVWTGRGLPAPDEKDLGLDFFTILVPDKAALTKVKRNVEKNGEIIISETEASILLPDPSGINVRIEIE
ncbi:VOC family protein [Enterococcus sp. BWT-B8]|uniref:VOC family protein n=1 Tax=Enterococcus sp. BWT-B8 TaxID=2885157 RepID=UPI001E461C76|nr:VOC family protein [Enterococcus sp. BWT-B8]MCB5951193.1 VOC family protein [Enterococcus sp. BWT-B8]